MAEGDFVWMPVEVPGASYGVEEEKGIASVFEPMNITWEVTDATLDQAEVITRMTDYMTANQGNVKAIIGLGDMVTGSVARVWKQAGIAAGEFCTSSQRPSRFRSHVAWNSAYSSWARSCHTA